DIAGREFIVGEAMQEARIERCNRLAFDFKACEEARVAPKTKERRNARARSIGANQEPSLDSMFGQHDAIVALIGAIEAVAIQHCRARKLRLTGHPAHHLGGVGSMEE